MVVRKIENDECGAYDSLAEMHGTVFNRVEWVRMFGEDVQILGVYNRSNELIGGLTFRIKRKLGLKMLMAQPLSPATGPFYSPVAVSGIKRAEEARSVVEALAAYIDAEKFAVVSIPLSPCINDVLPFVWKDYKVVPRYTYRVNLRDASIDEIFKQMSGDTKNVIRKANKDGVRCERVFNMSDVFALIKKTFGRQKIEFSESLYKRILCEFATDRNSAAFVSYLHDRPSASVFTVRDKRTCYYLMGGYDCENKHNGAGPLALYSAILQAKEDGCDTFDFEGSIVPQIEKYFRGFGGTLTPYFVVNKAWLPSEVLLKPFKRRMF